MFRIIALIVALCPMPAFAQGDPTVELRTGDPDMAAAVDHALATMPLLLSHALDGGGISIDGMYIKVAMPTIVADPSIENIWIGPFARYDKTAMAGLLANEPNLMGDLHVSDLVDFTRDMIVNWSYKAPYGTRYGNYTTRLVVARLPADQGAEIMASFPDNPIPADWK